MTDPVDADALDAAWEKYATLNNMHPHSIDRDTFEQGWEAAADEMDRLRDRLHHVEKWTVPEAIRIWKLERAEVERLRTLIRNAPHDEGCHPWRREDGSVGAACICWKADAL